MRMIVALSVLLASVMSVNASTTGAIPVVIEMPTCPHDKLGQVQVVEGSRPAELAGAMLIRPADYDRAFAALREAATARGGNVAVLRRHSPVFYEASRSRDARPIRVRLTAAVLRLHDPQRCALAVIGPERLRP